LQATPPCRKACSLTSFTQLTVQRRAAGQLGQWYLRLFWLKATASCADAASLAGGGGAAWPAKASKSKTAAQNAWTILFMQLPSLAACRPGHG